MSSQELCNRGGKRPSAAEVSGLLDEAMAGHCVGCPEEETEVWRGRGNSGGARSGQGRDLGRGLARAIGSLRVSHLFFIEFFQIQLARYLVYQSPHRYPSSPPVSHLVVSPRNPPHALCLL